MAVALIYAALLGFIPYLVAVWRPPKLKWVVAVAILARLAMLAAPVTLSGDIYRYAWEGKVMNAGHNPYRLAPDAAALAGLRDANWERVEHREVPSAYPPLLLLVFRAEGNFRLIFTAFDLATLWFIVRLLRARGQNESLALVWAWNPLVILEFAGNGHALSMAICCFVAGLWLLAQPLCSARPSRPEKCNNCYTFLAGAAVAFAGACLSHFWVVPLVLATVAGARVKRPEFWLVFAALIVLGFVPFADAGSDLVAGLAHVGGRWRFNGSIFELLVKLFDDEAPRQLLGGVWLVYAKPKLIATAGVAGVFMWTLLRRYRPARAALAVAGAMLVLSPVVHPWYVTWMVALVCLEFRVAWLAFSGFVIVSYVAKVTELQTGVWIDLALVRWMEYAPLFVLLIAEWRHRRFDSAGLPR
jgi:hypothetical protein